MRMIVRVGDSAVKGHETTECAGKFPSHLGLPTRTVVIRRPGVHFQMKLKWTYPCETTPLAVIIVGAGPSCAE